MQAIATTFELCGEVKLTKEKLKIIERSLSKYTDDEIQMSLDSCLERVKGRLSLSDIISNIPRKPNERPGADEAFAKLPRHESQSVVWTVEMATAYGQVAELLAVDPVGARMAFRDHYTRLVDVAESMGIPAKWEFSGGTDKSHRETVLKNAIDSGLLEPEYARKLLPQKEEQQKEKLLSGDQENISEYIQKLKKQMGIKF